MVVVSTITEINYSVASLFYNLVRPLIYICDIEFFGYTICVVSGVA